MCTAFHTGPHTAENTKVAANEIGYAVKLEWLERAAEVSAMVSNNIYLLA